MGLVVSSALNYCDGIPASLQTSFHSPLPHSGLTLTSKSSSLLNTYYTQTSFTQLLASTSADASSDTSTSVCAVDNPCTGDITYYDTGLGACGTTNDGLSENVVALPYGLMGTANNNNPYCGKRITIACNGKTATAVVVDKCMGCQGESIDLSRKAFRELAEYSVGRTTAEWWFNE